MGTKEIATVLYDTTKKNISSHLVKVFKENEIDDEVRASERMGYQNVTDIYTTAMNRSVNTPTKKTI